ncbi:MAG TPA: pilus assembly protein TadG-related protein [Brevundimonas sp.]|nr:pilus assembly protein TadG-related protein [Brevundimonas sp.]
MGGNVGTLAALLIVPMVGTIGLAIEGGSWLVSQRSMQHAADSAAIAAATNNSANFIAEARAVSAEYGFSHGANAVTVDVIDNAACPAPSTETNCYQVTVTRPQRLYLLGIVRFAGDTTIEGRPAQTVVAQAVARRPGRAATYCMVGLGESGQSIRVNGGPNVDLAGCDMFSNSNLTCNGANSDTGVYYGDSVGTSSCGQVERPGQTVLPDPFSYLSANPPIPANTCSSYPQGAAGPTINSATSFASSVSRCGDTRLTSNVTVTTANSVLVVYNGRLDLNGFTLKTSGSGSLTLIFSGTNQNGGPTTYNHVPVNTTGTGVLDIAAPKTGALKGVAMMQDGRLTGSKNNVNLLYTGNDPTLMIQGLIYMPNGEFDIRGAINLKSGGLACLGVVAKTILVSGTGSVFDNASSQCVQAGLNLPDIPGTEQRLGLVQ